MIAKAISKQVNIEIAEIAWKVGRSSKTKYIIIGYIFHLRLGK